ncbi:MAG: SDR family oxidoreductase [Proteobacteria bacterium]|nr:SDR family NAD(P)-dependent oxidoreductase [Desulfobacteraceae bacterium]MBU4002907.1 SDR family oxidoreductase [Pseudomonadota bacterium]MBU4053355.1 SDR family oxidoreductase [Pseudomonadota bacterium]MBU4315763.1 SDR family oxidoreductase [Pseudomonadota bacterium]MBU4471621.1 SDR family oxidoreductase [Pseudomonadota bacterium]
MDVKGSVGLVTGANRGIGKACVEALLMAGSARVYAAARNELSLAPLVEADPDRIVPVTLDITNPEQIKSAAERCFDVNLLVNNAGVSNWLKGYMISSETTEIARLEMETNYFGTLEMCRAFAPVLKANGGGAIANILSAGALVSVPPLASYSASKAAAASMTQGVRAELKDQGTLVMAFFVGSVDTRMATDVGAVKVQPSHIGEALIDAVLNETEDIYTDPMAKELRANLDKDPKRVERQMYKLMKMLQVKA